MSIAYSPKNGTFSGDHMTHIYHTHQTPCMPAKYRFAQFLSVGILVATLAACGGGGGSSSTTPTQTALDAAANSKAVADMSSTPVNVAVWDQLNAAGTDIVRSMASTSDTVTISTFESKRDPTGGSSMIDIFTGVVATGTYDASRVFQLTSGSLPLSGNVWVNVKDEDFTKNNAGGENALVISIADLKTLPLPAPIP